ncbi:MAG: type IX secretion system sortase PorU [Bacteroidota bacterium]
MRKILSPQSCLFFVLLFVVSSSFGQGNATESVLASGDWYKVRISNTGVYKVSYDFLKTIGYPVSGLRSDQVKLYGNSAGLLPFKNDLYRPDDLLENALIMFDGGDGTFDSGDYFLFYAKAADTWAYNQSAARFEHTRNFYEDYSYFFLTKNDKTPKRTKVFSEPSDPETAIITEFPDYQVYDRDLENLAHSGRTMYGEKFSTTLSYGFNFSFPDIVSSSPARIAVDMAYSGASGGSVKAVSGGKELGYLTFNNTGGYLVASTNFQVFSLSNPGSSIRLDLSLRKSSDETAWLNYIEVSAFRKLNLTGNFLAFRTAVSLKANKVLKMKLTGASANTRVFDVTNPVDPQQITGVLNGTEFEFKHLTDTLHEFIAISGNSFSAPSFVGKVANQNLHALNGVDMVIVVHPDFQRQAERLATFHRQEGLKIEVLTPSVIYNEFSTGARDATAIKDLMKMLYSRAGANVSARPKYLLLFGDGSYINKDYTGNTNYLPTFQSDNSESLTDSYVTDDYFGLLEPNEGEAPANTLDIGIGRFPVSNIQQATEAVDKVLRYASTGYAMNESSPFGDWRNKVLFLADDLSGNPGSITEVYHMVDSDELATKVDDNYKPYLTEKVYLDAYKQVSTPGGERYPQAASDFRNKVQQGALIVNYIGHGGEVGLTHERVVDVKTIEEWTNIDALPLFVTATCEFSRFDDPARTSAGELAFLNSKGGAIALLTTTRLVYSGPNMDLNRAFYNYALPDNAGNSRTLGEIIMLTKRAVASGSSNYRNFMLIGDPAMKLAYPKHKVNTVAINTIAAANFADTLKAFGKVKIDGNVTNFANQLLDQFNGVVDVTVFDKADKLRTLGNDNPDPSYRKEFMLKNKIIYKGKASVKNGLFSIEFIIPKDISYVYGKGTILYYATNGTDDANGSDEDVTIGGVSSTGLTDNEGPAVSLFMNTTDFNPGDITNEEPSLLAFVSDESGINTTGNGIGHELLATLDANTENAVVLNNYYVADLDTYKKGTIRYPYKSLSTGPHTLTVKVWDINNNSATATTNFIVANANDLTVENLMNYPNPMTDITTFSFDHNQAGKNMSVKIEIYDAVGKKIKEINVDVNDPGYQSKTITWDGTADGGNTIERGIYVYRLIVKKEDGSEVSKTNRLLLLK